MSSCKDKKCLNHAILWCQIIRKDHDMEESKIKIALLSSRKLNEQEIFNEHKNTIENFIKNFTIDEVKITIGNIKNKLIINCIQDLGFDVSIVQQQTASLENSNKKIIRENEIIVFLRYDNSPTMGYLLDYAIGIDKNTVPINLN